MYSLSVLSLPLLGLDLEETPRAWPGSLVFAAHERLRLVEGKLS